MVRYEWVIEELDPSDRESIVAVNHADTYAEAVAFAEGLTAYDIGLVRDTYNQYEELCTRSWAYVEDGKLPEVMRDAFDCELAKVPAKYRQQFEKSA